jgi:hypothetical protein
LCRCRSARATGCRAASANQAIELALTKFIGLTAIPDRASLTGPNKLRDAGSHRTGGTRHLAAGERADSALRPPGAMAG